MRKLITVAVLSCSLLVPTTASAETAAQRESAKERVIREAVKLQKRNRYTTSNGTRITPEARWTLWGTNDTDSEVTMKWRIRVKTKPQTGTAGWLICRGRVTVRGTDVNNKAAHRASLATDSCIA